MFGRKQTGRGTVRVDVDYVECGNCGFVLLAAGDAEPVPERVDECPDCGGTEFGFVDR